MNPPQRQDLKLIQSSIAGFAAAAAAPIAYRAAKAGAKYVHGKYKDWQAKRQADQQHSQKRSAASDAIASTRNAMASVQKATEHYRNMQTRAQKNPTDAARMALTRAGEDLKAAQERLRSAQDRFKKDAGAFTQSVHGRGGPGR